MLFFDEGQKKPEALRAPQGEDELKKFWDKIAAAGAEHLRSNLVKTHIEPHAVQRELAKKAPEAVQKWLEGELKVKESLLAHRRIERAALLERAQMTEADIADAPHAFDLWSQYYDEQDQARRPGLRAAFEAVPRCEEKLELHRLDLDIKIFTEQIAALHKQIADLSMQQAA